MMRKNKRLEAFDKITGAHVIKCDRREYRSDGIMDHHGNPILTSNDDEEIDEVIYLNDITYIKDNIIRTEQWDEEGTCLELISIDE